MEEEVAQAKLLSASKDRGYQTGAAPSVHHRDDPQRLFFRRVGYQVVTHQNKSQRA